MKTTGLFNNCVVTKQGAFFCGTTKEGTLIYADNTAVQRGFKLFTNYKLYVREIKQDIPLHGNHFCASICRIPAFFQMPEWLRLQQVAHLFRKAAPREATSNAKSAIATVEGIVSESRLQSVVKQPPSSMWPL
jgi:hypothetical protein